MADEDKAQWRLKGSPLFVGDSSYLGGMNVIDARQALHLPCTVTGLTVQGNERTRRQLIEKEMHAALKAKTHAELAKGAWRGRIAGDHFSCTTWMEWGSDGFCVCLDVVIVFCVRRASQCKYAAV